MYKRQIRDFTLFRYRPRTVLAGLIGQIILLPLLAIFLGSLFHLDALFFIGLLLICLLYTSFGSVIYHFF